MIEELISAIRKEGCNPRAAFYGRHSTDKQKMDMQKEAAHRLALKYNFEIIAYYEDKDVSAKRVHLKDRVELWRLLLDVKKGDFQFVVAYSDTRLARDPIEHAHIRALLEGIPVVLCNNESLYNPPHAELLSQLIKDGSSKFEIDQTSERTRDTFVYKVARGESINGSLPYGYEYSENDGRFIVSCDRKRLEIKTIFTGYINGEGFSAIAKQLNWYRSSGVPNKERVKSIVCNPFYAGYRTMNKVKRGSRMTFVPQKDWIMGMDPRIVPVIEKDVWDSCYSLYEAKKEKKLTPKLYKTPFVLAELLWCGDCRQRGEPCRLRGVNGIKRNQGRRSGSRYYICTGCRLKVDAEALHDVFIKEVFHPLVARSTKEWDETVLLFRQRTEDELNRLNTRLNDHQLAMTKLQESQNQALQRRKEESNKDAQNMQKQNSLLRVLDLYMATSRTTQGEGQAKQRQLESRMAQLKKWIHDERQLEQVRVDLLREQNLRMLVLSLISRLEVRSSGRDMVQLYVEGRVMG